MELFCKSLENHRSFMAHFKINVADVARFSFDFVKASLRGLDLFLVLRQKRLCSVLTEASLDHFFNFQCFNTKKIQDHVVSQSELRAEFGRVSKDHLAEFTCGWRLRLA